MSQKTFDRQSAKFIARVAENLPELSGKEMQFFIENPAILKTRLLGAFDIEVEAFKEVETRSFSSEQETMLQGKSINVLSLSDHVKNILKRAQINTIRQLVGHTKFALLRYRYVSEKVIEKINNALVSAGYNFAKF